MAVVMIVYKSFATHIIWCWCLSTIDFAAVIPFSGLFQWLNTIWFFFLLPPLKGIIAVNSVRPTTLFFLPQFLSGLTTYEGNLSGFLLVAVDESGCSLGHAGMAGRKWCYVTEKKKLWCIFGACWHLYCHFDRS